LGIDGGFGCEGVQIAIEVGLKDHAVIGDFAQAGEAEDLKAAGIGEDGVGPGHEAVQAAHAADGFVAGAEVEVVGVGEHDFDAEVGREVALVETLDGSLRADGHEDRSFDGAMRGVEEAGAGAGGGTLGDDLEGDLRRRHAGERRNETNFR